MNFYERNEDMSAENENISKDEIVYIITLDEILESTDIRFLMDCKDAYEEVENYEYCAKIRDRILELENETTIKN